MMNDQRSTTDQLQDLVRLANAHGLYDAADFVRAAIERRGETVPDIKDIDLPKTTKEFAQWLRDVAEQVDRIGDRPLQIREQDVEVGFYYGNPAFPDVPTGLHFTVDNVEA